MKKRKIYISLIAAIFPLVVLILFISDTYDVFYGNYDYPFGIDMISKDSIYASKQVYVTRNFLLIAVSLIVIFLSFRKKWIWYTIFLILLLILLYVPKV